MVEEIRVRVKAFQRLREHVWVEQRQQSKPTHLKPVHLLEHSKAPELVCAGWSQTKTTYEQVPQSGECAQELSRVSQRLQERTRYIECLVSLLFDYMSFVF